MSLFWHEARGEGEGRFPSARAHADLGAGRLDSAHRVFGFAQSARLEAADDAHESARLTLSVCLRPGGANAAPAVLSSDADLAEVTQLHRLGAFRSILFNPISFEGFTIGLRPSTPGSLDRLGFHSGQLFLAKVFVNDSLAACRIPARESVLRGDSPLLCSG
jgi:hypothetical protein